MGGMTLGNIFIDLCLFPNLFLIEAVLLPISRVTCTLSPRAGQYKIYSETIGANLGENLQRKVDLHANLGLSTACNREASLTTINSVDNTITVGHQATGCKVGWDNPVYQYNLPLLHTYAGALSK